MQKINFKKNDLDKTIIIANEKELVEFWRADMSNISYLLCAKEPYHRFFCGGYTGRSLDKSDHRYLFVYPNGYDNILSLNMVDAPKKEFFADIMINEGLNFIDRELDKNNKVVVVCNKGESRSPTMVLMYLMRIGYFKPDLSAEDVFDRYLFACPNWRPNKGILDYCREYWNKLKQKGEK